MMMDIYVFGAVCFSAGIIIGTVFVVVGFFLEETYEERKCNEGRHRKRKRNHKALRIQASDGQGL